MENILDSVKRIHFVGIGGAAMCPMAEILLHKGYTVSGSDQNQSDTLDRVKTWGIPVYMGHRAENIGDDVQALVYTSACKADNPELVEARKRGIPTLERCVMQGMLTDHYPQLIGVSGTHGKTTTTSMLTQIFIEAGKDPSAIIGGKLPLIGSNSRVGSSGTIICEADEYVETFLHLHPAVSVILNIDADHLEYYKTFDNVVRAFRQYAAQTSQLLVVNNGCPEAAEIGREQSGKQVVSFGLDDSANYFPAELQEEPSACEDFTLMYKPSGSEPAQALGQVKLKVPGRHNMLNALAAAATAHAMGIDGKAICASLGRFAGVHRRFEVLGKFGGVTVADDFAHHPTELTAVLSSAMRMGYRQVWAVFQPHTYSRTYNLLDDFAKALSIPDHLIMTEILAVREENTYGIYTSDLAAKIPGSLWFDSFEKIAEYVMGKAEPGDLILTLGGGDIYKCANLIVNKYQALAE